SPPTTNQIVEGENQMFNTYLLRYLLTAIANKLTPPNQLETSPNQLENASFNDQAIIIITKAAAAIRI
ncbi:hypothetical protein ABTG52_13420, partial [Acinetobacter baumannii]